MWSLIACVLVVVKYLALTVNEKWALSAVVWHFEQHYSCGFCRVSLSKNTFLPFPLQLLVVLGGRAPLCLRWTCCRHCVGESHPRHTMRLFFLFFLTKFLSLPLFAVAWNPRLRSCRVSLRAKSFKAAACDLGGFSLITPAHNTRAHAPGGARDKVIRCFDPQV